VTCAVRRSGGVDVGEVAKVFTSATSTGELHKREMVTSSVELVDPFPLIPGTQWLRSFPGKYTTTVVKDTVVITFEITMSVTTTEVP